MRKLYLFTMMFLASLCMAFAQDNSGTTPEPIKYAAEDAPESEIQWYYIEFDRAKSLAVGVRSKTYKDKATDMLVSVEPSEQDETQLFRIISEDLNEGIALKNKKGQYVILNYVEGEDDIDSNTSRFIVTMDKQENNLTLTQNPDGTCEIGVADSKVTGRMNIWGGAAIGTEMGRYTDGDGGNKLRFVKPENKTIVTRVKPEANKYYYIAFDKGGGVLANLGVNENLETKSPEIDNDAQLWKIVDAGQDLQDVEILSKEGNLRIVYDKDANKFKAAVATEENKAHLRIVGSLAKDLETSWMLTIQDETRTMNQDGGAGIGKPLCLWGSGGTENNAFQFKTADELGFPEQPIYSSEETGDVFYRIVFNAENKHGHPALTYVAAEGENPAKLVVKAVDEANDNQLFRLVGKAGNFELISKVDNKRISFEGGKYTISNMQPGELKLVKTSTEGHWEINRRYGEASKAMNIDGGWKKDKEAEMEEDGTTVKKEAVVATTEAPIGEYNLGDPNNILKFVKVSESKPFTAVPEVDPSYVAPERVTPIFSSEENGNVWYKIQFDNGENLLTVPAEGNALGAFPAVEGGSDTQLFRLVGNEGDFILLSKSGVRVTWNKDLGQYILTNEGEQEPKVELKKIGHFSWEIHNQGDSQGMNLFGGMNKAGNPKIGKWNKGDRNNALKFVEASKEDFTEVPPLEAKKYAILLEEVENGSVTLMVDGKEIAPGTKVAAGTEVVIKLTPDAGYTKETLAVKINGEDAELEENKFTVTAETLVWVSFIKGTAIEALDATEYTVQGRTVVFNKAQHIVVYALNGQKLAEVNAASVVIPEGAGRVVLVKAGNKVLKLAL